MMLIVLALLPIVADGLHEKLLTPVKVDLSTESSIATPRNKKLSFIELESKSNHERASVWVQSYGRSGSSTVLSMLEAAGKSQLSSHGDNDDVFGLFEPCHPGDAVTAGLDSGGCFELLSDIAACNFSHIKQLWGFGLSKAPSLPDHPRYDQTSAQEACQAADLVAFKTVSYGHNLTNEAVAFLDRSPQVKVIDVVRDPRGIFASWKKLYTNAWSPSWSQKADADNSAALREICDNYHSNLLLLDPRIARVIFERLIADPESVMRNVYSFLGLQFGDQQLQWINATFDADACSKPDSPMRDCHTNSSEPLDRFRTVLSAEEMQAFAEYEPCQQIAHAYGYTI